MASRRQLFAILTDFDPLQGVPKSYKTTKKPKKSDAKKSPQNKPPSEPPKMSSGYLCRGLPQIEGVRVLATLSQENPNFAWKILHFLVFCKSWFFKPQGGIDNPQLACAAPCRTSSQRMSRTTDGCATPGQLKLRGGFRLAEPAAQLQSGKHTTWKKHEHLFFWDVWLCLT